MLSSIVESRLSASNAAIMSSGFALIPIKVQCEAREASSAFKRVSEIASALKSDSSLAATEIEFLAFDEPISPKFSRVEISQKGKDSVISVTLSMRSRFDQAWSFWERVGFLASIYERLGGFASRYVDAKGVEIDLLECKLEKQKDDPEAGRVITK